MQKNTEIGHVNLDNLEEFREGAAGIVVDRFGRAAFMSQEVFSASSYSGDDLMPNIVLRVEATYDDQQNCWNVVRVFGLYESQPAVVPAPALKLVPGQYLRTQFADLRPAVDDGGHTNPNNGLALYGVHDPKGALLYFVVVKRGGDVVERTVRSTDLKLGLAAIGIKPEPEVSAGDALGDVAFLQDPAPTKESKPRRPKTPRSPKKPKPPTTVVKGLADLASVLPTKSGDTNINTTAH